jgi:hypothetical protein
MRRRSTARAFLLLAIFLGAGSCLPSLDALVYHSQAAELQQPHVEEAGQCVSHAERCTLGRTAPGSGAIGTLPDDAPVASSSLPAARSLVTQHSSGIHGTPPVQPRAPPVPLA